tara:strand:+ start:530 stop:1048 length:519 start_codon:yes stop_codon:yes gene_type:complete
MNGIDWWRSGRYDGGGFMKDRFPIICLILIASSAAYAQVSVPPNPNQFTKRSLGGGGGVANPGGISAAVRQTQTIQYTSVSPLRGWTNTGGKTIQARLLAFAAPAPGETGPVEVIRDGKVRFLMPGKPAPVDYPLEQLDPAARAEVERIAKAAANGAPKPAEEKPAEKTSAE